MFKLPHDLGSAGDGLGALCPWYANVLNIGSSRLLHYMSSQALLSVIIPQRERRSAELRFVNALYELLGMLAVPTREIEREILPASFEYARATNRSVLGSMRDQAILASYQFDAVYTLLDLEIQLADTPCGPIGYASPRKLAPQLLAAKWRFHQIVT